MKVRVSQLHPNPFRDLIRYPVEPEKVEELKRSMKDLKVWPNILVRPHPTRDGEYEVAYGHNRLVAMAELLGPDGTVEIPEPQTLSDADMLRIMVRENDEAYRIHSKHDRECIRAVRAYLIAHPGHWTKKATTNVDSGPGAKAIADFLKWSQKKVSEKKLKNHLEIIVAREKDEVPSLVEHMPLTKARKFVALARRLPLSVQEALARTLNEEDKLPESKIPLGWHQAPSVSDETVSKAERFLSSASHAVSYALQSVLYVPDLLEAVLAAEPEIDQDEEGNPSKVDKLLVECARLRQILDKVLEWSASRVPRPPRLVKDAEPDPDNPDPLAEGYKPRPGIGHPAQPDDEELRQAWGPPGDAAPKRKRQRQWRRKSGA